MIDIQKLEGFSRESARTDLFVPVFVDESFEKSLLKRIGAETPS